MSRNYASERREDYLSVRKSPHSAHKLDFHIVLGTKAKRPLFRDEETAEKVFNLILSICKEEGYLALAISVQSDHLHLFLGLAPKHSVSDVVKIIKARVSRELGRGLGSYGNIWAQGFYAESLGFKNPGQIKAYIDRQSERHGEDFSEDSQD